MGFHRGTWQWEAVALKGAVLSRKNGLRVADLEDIGIAVFRVKPAGPVGPLTVSWSGSLRGQSHGIVVSRGVVELYPAGNVSDLRFTRRQSGALGGPMTHEEILIRYLWAPANRRVKVHIRPGQVLVSEDVD